MTATRDAVARKKAHAAREYREGLYYAVNSYSGVILSTWSLFSTLRELPGRCAECGCHKQRQGHNPDCPIFTRERGR